MGILNVTPDSFSDGGQFVDPAAAQQRALAMVEEGADILDVGGESTRPYSSRIDEQTELNRVSPVLRAICESVTVPVSIDTTKSAVARAALDLGAEIINDISGFQFDPKMIELAVQSKAGVCAMHIQGTPQDMQDNPHYDDLIGDISAFLADRRDALIAAGVEAERICLDPGVGFGKTHQHNLDLIANCHRLHELGQPILVGHSRKGFITRLLGENADQTAGTIGSALSLARQGVQIIRVHDVRAVKHALRLFAATGGMR